METGRDATGWASRTPRSPPRRTRSTGNLGHEGTLRGGTRPSRSEPVHYTRSMPTLREHLESPQFTDENGESLGESVVGRVGGTWVKSGEPRWKAYLFYLIVLGGGLGLVLTTGGSFDIFAMFGVLCLGLGVFGGSETLRNKPYTRIFGGPTKPD